MGEIWDSLTNTEVVHVPADMFDEAIAQAQIAGWKLLWINGYRNSARLQWAGNSGSLLGHLVVGVLTIPFTAGLGNVAYGLHKKGKTTRYLKIKIK